MIDNQMYELFDCVVLKVDITFLTYQKLRSIFPFFIVNLKLLIGTFENIHL